MQLTTHRLTIRPWRREDLPAFARLNSDPEVRRYYYPAVLTQTQSNDIVEQCTRHLNEYGFAFLAVERRDDQIVIGGAGLSWTSDLPGGPAVEIGWILDRPFWRQGYASEASRAWLAHGWSLGLEQIVGYTSAINLPSRALMEALGMSRNPADDFCDPTVPPGNPLSPHVLYRLRNPRGPGVS